MFIANRTQKRQEKKIVEESGQPLLTLRSQGCVLVVSGDANSVRQIKEAKPILDYLEQILLINPAPEEGREYVCDEEDDKKQFIPKLFCQIGDKEKGWVAKPVEKMASLLLTILDAGQGVSVTLSDKSKPRPEWINNDAGWKKYTQTANY